LGWIALTGQPVERRHHFHKSSCAAACLDQRQREAIGLKVLEKASGRLKMPGYKRTLASSRAASRSTAKASVTENAA
jgi:hypothetical protein